MSNHKFHKLIFKLENLSRITVLYDSLDVSTGELSNEDTEDGLIYILESHIWDILGNDDYEFEQKFLEKCNKLLEEDNLSVNNCVLIANLIIKLKLEQQKLS